MKKALFQIVTVLFFVTLISSCEMNKRRYMRGYDISFINQKKASTNIQSEKTTHGEFKIENSEKNQTSDIVMEYDQPIMASVNSELNINTKKESFILLDNDCDNIIMKNGNEIKCKVLEIGTTEIKYKKCDNLNGPTYTITKQETLMIQYANGTKEIMPQQEANNSSNNNQSNKGDFSTAKNHPLAVWSLVCGLVGWVVFFIGIPLSIIFGAIALNKIKNNPEKYKGKGMALAGLIIGIVAMGILLLLLLIAL